MRKLTSIKLTGALVILMIAMTACDPTVVYEKAIINSTSGEILLVRNNPLELDSSLYPNLLLDSAFLLSGDRQLLSDGFDIGGSTDDFTDCPGFLEGSDTIYVYRTGSNNQQSVIRLTQLNFAGKHEKLSNSSCECVFEINDEMFDD